DQRNRPMLQFAGRITFRMDIGDFLELQRAFHGQRIIGVTPEVQDVMHLRELACDALNLIAELQGLCRKTRRLGKFVDETLFLLTRDVPPFGGSTQAKGGKYGKLAGE